MPRTYVKKMHRAEWSVSQLRAAARVVENKAMSLRKASSAFGIPRSTLFDALNGRQSNPKHEPGHLGRYAVFTKEMESELSHHAREMCNRFFGLTSIEFRTLAFDFAEINEIVHPFNKEKKCAGKDWLSGFFKRNPNLSLRLPESTSFSRAVGFRKSEVNRFFDNLKQVMDVEQFEPSRIYNVDESGFSTVPEHTNRVMAPKGQKQVGKLSSGEKGVTITVECAVSATGSYVPPMLIFPGKRMNQSLMNGAPPGSIWGVSDSGWINGELFVKWLNHFISSVGASKENKVLLILDSHSSHISLEVWNICRDNGVVLLSIPPHTSHKLQPLDRTVYGPLKSSYSNCCDRFLKNNPGRRITPYEVASLFGSAYIKTATIKNGIKGFKCTGITPYNPDVFGDEDFAPSLSLLRPVAEEHETEGSHRPDVTNHEVANDDPEVVNVVQEVVSACIEELDGDKECCMKVNTQSAEPRSPPKSPQALITNTDSAAKNGDESIPKTSPSFISVYDVSPLPQASPKAKRQKRKCMRSEILTSTPIKTSLEEKVSRNAVAERKQAPATRKCLLPQEKRSIGKKPKENAVRKGKGKQAKTKEWFCIFCAEPYIEPLTEDWIMCYKCVQRAHENCTDGQSTSKGYLCDFCRNY